MEELPGEEFTNKEKLAGTSRESAVLHNCKIREKVFKKQLCNDINDNIMLKFYRIMS